MAGGARGPMTGTQPTGMFTRNLIGSLAASAFRLCDPDDRIGIWYVSTSAYFAHVRSFPIHGISNVHSLIFGITIGSCYKIFLSAPKAISACASASSTSVPSPPHQTVPVPTGLRLTLAFNRQLSTRVGRLCSQPASATYSRSTRRRNSQAWSRVRT